MTSQTPSHQKSKTALLTADYVPNPKATAEQTPTKETTVPKISQTVKPTITFDEDDGGDSAPLQLNDIGFSMAAKPQTTEQKGVKSEIISTKANDLMSKLNQNKVEEEKKETTPPAQAAKKVEEPKEKIKSS